MSEAIERAQRDEAVRRAQIAAEAEHDPSFDGSNCVTCGDPVGDGRLKLQRIRCIECQTKKERQWKQR